MTEQDTPPALPTHGHLMPRPRTHEGTLDGKAVVRLAVEQVDPATGMRTRRLVVVDESDASRTRAASRAAFTALDHLLQEHPTWAAPDVVDDVLHVHNEVSEWIYSSPTLSQWRTHLVPKASALYLLQRPLSDHLLPGWGTVDALARTFAVDGMDGLGIRTRARVMQDLVDLPLREALGRGSARWVSLACGAAVPVLDTLARIGLEGAELALVDVDPEALSFASQLAQAQGLSEGTSFQLLQRDLVRGVVARADLVDELGPGTATVVDALGIFEYFSDASCVRMLRNAYRLVAPGGVLVVANMLIDRPELAFNQRGLGWPSIVPRSCEQLVQLVRSAGLPLARTTVSIAQDGLYAVVSIQR